MQTVNETLKQVVVTGGSGAIGSMLVRRLLADGAERVVVVDDLSSGHAWLLPDDRRVELVVEDVVRLPGMDLGVEEPHVFHLAAFFANQNSVDNPEADLHTNGLGTLNVLRWAVRAGARRVVYASTGCTIVERRGDEPTREDMAVSLHQETPYQITKTLGELYCNYFLAQVSSVRCRFFNSYGPGEVPGPYRNVIPRFIWSAIHGEPLVIAGTGEETRDFTYVEDVVDGLVRCARTALAHGEAVNLGTGIQTRIIDMARMVIEITGSDSAIEFAPRRPWDHTLRRQADNSKAGSLVGLTPRVPLRDGLEAAVAWLRENRQRIDLVVSPPRTAARD